MPIVAADWSVDRETGNIRYIGNDHVRFGGSTPSYATVIEFHRWLQGLADDASYTGNDELDITDATPSERATDNYVTLINGFNIDDNAAEHLYDGSIVQDGGNVIYDGIVNFGNSGVLIQIIQNGAVLSDDWWNTATAGLNPDSTAGITHRFMIKTRTGGTDIDLRKLVGTARRFGYTYQEFNINGTSRGNNVLALADATDLNNATVAGTVATWNEIDNNKTDSTTTVNGVNNTGQAVLNVASGAAFTSGEFITVGATSNVEYQIISIATNALTLSRNLESATTGGEAVYKVGWGYNHVDVDGDGVVEEYFYSKWDKHTYTINQFYERMKWLSRDGSTQYIAGLPGELFRGITHEIAIGGADSGTFKANEHVTWSGGSGRMLAIDNVTAASTTKLWIQLLTGTAPTSQLITGAISGATCTATGATERPISKPFCGASTGSALIGAYGFTLEYADLSNSDLLLALDNSTYQPPNNVTFTVFGLSNGQDRVLVAPLGYRFFYDTEAGGPFSIGETLTFTNPAGTATLARLQDYGTYGEMWISSMISGTAPTDNSTISGGTSSATAAVNGTVSNDINFRQMTLNGNLTGAAVTSVVVDSIPADCPSSGQIRIERDSGLYSLHTFSSKSGSTFTITSNNFSTDNATDDGTVPGAANLFIAYIDKLAAATSESFTVVYSANRDLFVRVRDGDGSPIKTFETSASLGAAGGSATAIRTPDV